MGNQAPVVEQRCEASVRRDQQPQGRQGLDHRGFGRAAVGLIAGSTAVHLTLAERAVSTEALLLLVAMAGACLACVPALWRGGSLHSWMTMLGLTGAMLFAHLELCFACGPSIHAESELGLGLGTHLFGQGLSSLALWLMAAEMALAAAAVVRLLHHPNHNNPEVVPS
jgi:hypothetical protein